MTKLITRNYEVALPRLPRAFSGFRIVFLSDLHGCRYGEQNEELFAKIKAAMPDLILVGGDMLLGLRNPEDWRKTGAAAVKQLLCPLAEQYPVYYTDGNHEGKCPPDKLSQYRKSLERAGVCFLNNTSKKFEKEGSSIWIHGLVLEKRWYPKGKRLSYPVANLVDKLGHFPAKEQDGQCHILLAHHPLYFKTYREWGADVVLSGHLHGGVVRLPFIGGLLGPDFLPFPPYSGGQYQEGKAQMVVSCGLGSHSVPFRLFNPAEVSVLTLRRGKPKKGKKTWGFR